MVVHNYSKLNNAQRREIDRWKPHSESHDWQCKNFNFLSDKPSYVMEYSDLYNALKIILEK